MVEVYVDDDMAMVVFPRGQRLRGVAALLIAAKGRPELVQKVTLPEVAYVVPVEVARSAGLIDGSTPSTPAPATQPPQEPSAPPTMGYDDGKPDMDWSRAALEKYAADLGLDGKHYRNKDALLEAIRDAEA